MAKGSKDQPLLSVVVPTRNESGNVVPLCERVATALDGVDFEICFVDDSDDTTVTVLATLEETDPRVHCRFRQGDDRIGGLSTAVITGLRMARGRYVCVMDADLQHPPELIPQLLAAAQGGSDLVVASRYLRDGSSSGLANRTRHLVSSGARLIAKALFAEARRSTDPLSGFFLCRRDLIDGIEFRPVGFKILLELLVCVPSLRVSDVPLEFAGRASGESKATLGQGWLFLKHISSLFTQVSGSARPWKFAMVGASGLLIYIGLLEVFHRLAGMSPEAAFFPAFVPSLVWNTVVNRLWTFSDRRGRLVPRETRVYLIAALLNGVLVYVAFRLLLSAGTTLPLAGLLSAAVAMAANGLVNLRQVSRRPLIWSQVSTDTDIRDGLIRLARTVGAGRAYVLPPDAVTSLQGVPPDVVERALRLRRAVLWTEASSHRAQRRTNIDLTSILLVPVVNGGSAIALVVCERTSPTPYPPRALERATRGVETMVPALVSAAGLTAARLEERMRVGSSD